MIHSVRFVRLLSASRSSDPVSDASPSRCRTLRSALCSLAVAALLAGAAAAQSGTVFEDYDGDGVRDATEPGVGGVTVQAFDASGAAVGSSTSFATACLGAGNPAAACVAAGDPAIGSYNLSLPGGGPFRIEFTGLPSYLEPAPQGSQNATSVQFVANSSATSVDFAVSDPAKFCESNPAVGVTCYVSGDPLVAGNAGAFDTVVDFPYAAASSTGANNQYVARAAVTGAVWGMAWDASTRRLFTSAVVRRHSGLGTGGEGAIYVTDYSAGQPATNGSDTSLFVDLDAVGINFGSVPSNAARGLVGDPTVDSADPAAYALVGKAGIGDIDLSSDGSTLYVMNLFDRSVYPVDASTGTVGAPLAVPDPCPAADQHRPWALKFHRGSLYAGVVCDASSSPTPTAPYTPPASLTAHVFELDVDGGASTFGPSLLTVPLGYERPTNVANHLPCFDDLYTRWHPWQDDDGIGGNPQVPGNCNGFGDYFWPTPILADLEFDDDGSLILGFADRMSMQLGHRNALPSGAGIGNRIFPSGDVLRAGFLNGAYTLEGGGRVATVRSLGQPNNSFVGPSTGIGGVAGGQGAGATPPTDTGLQGPAGSPSTTQSEFYAHDNFRWHNDTSLGAVALLPGADELALTAFDALGTRVNSNGVNYFDNTDGSGRPLGYLVFDSGTGFNAATFGKAAGLGDIELLCSAAPVEVGNRVWLDSDGDGVQDAGELPVVGVQVQLFDPGSSTVLGTATTDASGNFYFSSGPGTSTPAALYGLPILPGTAYQLRILNAEGVAQQAPLAGTLITRANALGQTGNDNVTDLNDSDAQRSGTSAVIDFSTGANGEHNHTLDFGFVAPVSIGSYVFEDNNANGLQDGGDTPIAGATVNLLVDDGSGSFVPAADTGGMAVPSQLTGATGLYFFDNLPPGRYRVQVTPPTGFTPTINQNGADNDDTENDSNIASQPVAGTWQSGSFDLLPGMEPVETNTAAGDAQDDGGVAPDASGNMTVDFGFVRPQPVSIGSYVFQDNNANGVQDGGDTPIAGATVSLLVDNGSGTFLPATDLGGGPVGAQVTGAGGLYFFDNLPPGNYRVRVTPPAGFAPTVNQNAADDDDTENDSNIASQPLAGTWESGTFTLSVGGEPVESNTAAGDAQDDGGIAPDSSGNMTVDFGFVPSTLGSIGDTIYLDYDGNGVQDPNDPGLEGVTVRLTPPPEVDLGNGPGQPVTTLTDAMGRYLFPNLPPGDYRVDVLLTGPRASMANTGDPDGGFDSTSRVSLGPGENDLDQDFGYQPVSPLYDYGDLPVAYGDVVDGVNAGGHLVLPVDNPTLGGPPDLELTGQPSTGANADTEEDGVVLPAMPLPGSTATIELTVDNPGLGPVYVNAFIDWNGDGDFDDTGEQIATALDVTSGGVFLLTVSVPATATPGAMLGARFRISSEPNLGPGGLAPDGEVEDYLLTIGAGGLYAIPVLGPGALLVFFLLLSLGGLYMVRRTL